MSDNENTVLNPKVDKFLAAAARWREEMTELRNLILECGLTEELKWGQPCYTYNGHNIVLIGAFKEYCALLFMKGALLKDPDNVLIRQTENVQAGRVMKFSGIQEIIDQKKIMKAYITEAVDIEKAGLKIVVDPNRGLAIPEELQIRFDESKEFEKAFRKLTAGRQRAYIFYFNSGKKSRTRSERIEKHFQRIMDGKGMNDYP